jgi:hypothetical protein
MVGDLSYKIVSFNMRSAGEYQEVVTLKVMVLTNLDGKTNQNLHNKRLFSS